MRSILDEVEAAVDAAASLDVGALSVGDLQTLVAVGGGLAGRLTGVVSRAVGELDVRSGGQVPDVTGAHCPTPAWLRTVAQVSGPAAGRQLRTAAALRELPAVADAIVDGQITVEHGRVLARLVGKIDPDALLASQPALLDIARRTDPDALGHYVRHLIATWCPPQLDADEAAAEDRRFLQLTDTHRGSVRGRFELPSADAEILLTVLEPLARRDGLDDPRTAGQRRADALTDVFGLALRHGDLPDSGGSRPRLTLLIPTGLPDRLSHFTVDPDAHPGAGCPTADWTGPQTRTRVATLLCDARIERLVLDPTGQAISLTSLGDDITTAQRRAVAARDRCCTAKGCSRPPAYCDVHHLTARADGGRHELDNLALLCRRHHVQWHRQQLGPQDLRLPWTQQRAPLRT